MFPLSKQNRILPTVTTCIGFFLMLQQMTINLWLAAAAKSLQSCPTLCGHDFPIDGSQPGSPIPRILQARTLEWVASSFSNAWKWKVKVKSLSCVRLFETPWTAAYQAPPPMGFFQARVLEWGAIAFSEICGLKQQKFIILQFWRPKVQNDLSGYIRDWRSVSTTSLHVKAPIPYVSVCAQSCLTLCDPIDCSPPGSSVHGVFQARILEWVEESLLQGILPTQGSIPHLLHLLHRQVGSLPLNHLGWWYLEVGPLGGN